MSVCNFGTVESTEGLQNFSSLRRKYYARSGADVKVKMEAGRSL